jgi:hypothetical protein
VDRRVFLQRSTTAAVAVYPGMSWLSSLAATASPLKTVPEYQASAQLYQAAIADLSRLPSLPATTASEIAQLLAVVDRAGMALDQRQSWMVMHFVSNKGVIAGVRARVRDKASFDMLVRDLLKDPQSVLSTSGVTTARAGLDTLLKSNREVTAAASFRLLEVLTNELKKLGPQVDLATRAAIEQAMARQAEAAQSAAIMAIVVAILIIVIAVVVSIFTAGTGLTAAYVHATAANLALTYKDLEGLALLRCLGAANLHYQSCLGAIPSTATTAEKHRARLRCQALWLAEKSSCNA